MPKLPGGFKFGALILLLVALFLGVWQLWPQKKEVEVKEEIKEGGEMVNLEDKKVLMVLAPENFRDEEFFQTRAQLSGARVKLVTCSKPKVEEAVGSLGGRVAIKTSPDKVNLEDFDAVVFVGGPGTSIYFNDQEILDLARKAYEQGKVLGAICIAPSILANAGVLTGKKVTAFSSEKGNLESKGANFTGKEVTVDGKIVTASGPQAAADFGKELVKVLSQ